MKFKVFENSSIASKDVAKTLIEAIRENKNIRLGLATGSTPIELYNELANDYANNQTDYSNVMTFNLDEYLGLPENHEQSYKVFMNQHLFSKTNVQLVNTHFPSVDNNYDDLIDKFGGIDIQILGIGTNGHIGFNEPGSEEDSMTRIVDLAQETIEVNAKKFFDGDTTLVPKQAVSMGLKSIIKAKKIILLAFGESKIDAINKLKSATKFDINFPASILVNHPDVTIVVDKLADNQKEETKDENELKNFPKDFIFSTSTCSYQIEGGRLLGNRKHSNWDKFTIDNYYIPPVGVAAREIASVDIASDFYHKYEIDAKIMNEMKVNGFAYNMDWARIFPDNTGIPNEEGLKFYEDVFKKLVENGVKPIPILYHWDTPLWLEELGGTSSRMFVDQFRRFAKVMFERLGKYTDIWYVNDENSTYTTSAYLDDYNPPQKKNEKEFWKALYYLTLSGAVAKEEFIKAKEKGFISQNALLGIDHDWNPAVPYDKNDKDDLEACKIFNEYNLDLYLDPNILGTFPNCFYEAIKKHNLESMIWDGDLEYLKEYTLDLIGWNYYRPAIIAHPKRMNENIEWFNSPQTFITDKAYIVFPKGYRYTDWKWLILPDYLSIESKTLYDKYKKPLMILENGIGYFDKKEDGIVKDDYRINYLNEHLREVQKAITNGIPFIGYSLWTYCDIFSPSGGYRKKYGLVGVDFEDFKLSRYPKASMYWYKDVIENLSTYKNDEINHQKYYDLAKQSFDNKKDIWK